MRSALDKLFHIVLLVYVRLVTTKESPENYMTSSFHGNMLYNNYILTIPALLDLSQLYGRQNAKIVERIMKNLFEIQPLYNSDLKQFRALFFAMMRRMEKKFDDRRVILPGNVIRISDTKGSSSEMQLDGIEKFALTMLDVFSTITVFLDNYPPAAKLFNRDKITAKIVSFYGNTVPEVYNKLVDLAYKDDCIEKYLKLKHLLNVTRIEILKFYRAIVYSTFKDIIEDTNSLTEVDIRSQVDEYFNLITRALSEKIFINDYHRHYPVDLDIDILQQTCPKIDLTRCEFILQSVCAGEKEVEKILNTASDSDKAIAGPSKVPEARASTSTGGASTSKANSSDRTEVELVSFISEVKDILNHLDEGFIQRCLKHYNYDTAAVINAVLEDSVPAHLKEDNSVAPKIPPDPEEASVAVDLAIGAQRLNVFDNDEFDIMTKDVVDTSRIHRGKRKDKHKNLNDLLNDKSHNKNLKDMYAKYSIVTDDYDDEYDDTYESHDAGLNARDLSTEQDVRPFTTPRIFLTRDRNAAASEDEVDSEDEGAARTQNGKDQFVHDPAELRARQEQRWQSKRGGRGGTTQSNRRDVVGKPKGQGQDTAVLTNRDNKNTNKATRANHNRRTGAQWKRRQGMVPS
ncbi:activating signal cointegrator 1 complex subunit 2 isoform X2 [Cephus cinctus]|nr:activating signal cointegrator 1 complex subunit 2 isoform X2 [Cephus cinctus]